MSCLANLKIIVYSGMLFIIGCYFFLFFYQKNLFFKNIAWNIRILL